MVTAISFLKLKKEGLRRDPKYDSWRIAPDILSSKYAG